MSADSMHKLFNKSLGLAASTAAKQEVDVQEMLLGKLALKAAKDPTFRQELRSDPQKVAQREADDLNIKLPQDVVEATDKLFNSAVPGANAQRVEELVFTTIDDMRKSFGLTLQLSTWLFIAGLLMIGAAFLTALVSDKLWAVGVTGGSGALSLLLSAVMNPLDRIRNAAGNLAQIQMAYLSFYKQLYILGDGGESLTREDALAYSQQIQKAATAMVDSVSSALDKSRAEVSGVKPSRPPTSLIPRNKGKDATSKPSKHQGGIDP